MHAVQIAQPHQWGKVVATKRKSICPIICPITGPQANPVAKTYKKFGLGIIMPDVTRILADIEQGDPAAAEQLLPLVYEELRKLAAAKMAQENPGQTLQATALVHEAYIRLVDVEKAQHWNSRGHFFGAAAEAMRRILLNRARDKGRVKRGGRFQRIDLDKVEIASDTPDDDLIALDEAIERLAGERQECADLAKMRFFAGLSAEEAGKVMGLPARTARRHWAYARAWLFDALHRDDTPAPA
jgi:RNA polymerase sigma factor (TIGR02999 family)